MSPHKIWLYMIPCFIFAAFILIINYKTDGLKLTYYPIIVPLSIILGIYGITYAKEPHKLMDNFKSKVSYEKAIEALKCGKMIHRADSDFPNFYGSLEVTINGDAKKYYGRIDKGQLQIDSSFIKFNDILSNEWVIENVPKSVKLKILED